MSNIIQQLIEANAVQNTILGVGTVFIMLIIISLIIYCFRFIPKLFERPKQPAAPVIQPEEKKKAPVAASAPAKPTVSAPAPAPAPAVSLMNDLELVAVISAAIAASEQIPLDGFIVRTIKRRA